VFVLVCGVINIYALKTFVSPTCVMRINELIEYRLKVKLFIIRTINNVFLDNNDYVFSAKGKPLGGILRSLYKSNNAVNKRLGCVIRP